METRAQSGGAEVLLPPAGQCGGDGEGSEAPAVLGLQQLCAVHLTNEYWEGPAGMQEQAQASGTEGAESGTSEASHSTARVGTASEQRLLGNGDGTIKRPVVRAQPGEFEELKPLRVTARGGAEGKHAARCARCGRCRCSECSAPLPLPACWLCGHRCLCSPESAVEHATCVCCLKALLYHCSSDDEDVSADSPFSCRQPRRCARWTAAGALALILPCLLCYLPARGCLALCQACHDRAHRPGCRCRVAPGKSTDV